MHYLYIMWLYALQFVTCKVSVDAFSLLYSKLSLFVFGTTVAESYWQFISICSRFIRDALFVTVDSYPRRSRVFADSRLISSFSYFT